MVQRLLIPRIVVDINRHGLERRDLRGEGVEEGVVLSTRVPVGVSCWILRTSRHVTSSWTSITKVQDTQGFDLVVKAEEGRPGDNQGKNITYCSRS